jgi:hypothetical protein
MPTNKTLEPASAAAAIAPQGQRRLPKVMSCLDSKQSALAAKMSDISEEAYCAGWMRDLEHSLWRAVVEGPRRYGWLALTEQHVAELRRLSADCAGWIAWDEELGETWLPMAVWLAHYDPSKAE